MLKEISLESSGSSSCTIFVNFSWLSNSQTFRERGIAQRKKRTLIARTHSFKTPYMYIRARASIEQREAPIREGARERTYAHKYPIQAHKTHAHTHTRATMRRDDKERALATSNAATASACAPLYVSQGRHVRLRTTYLYLCRFVHGRPRPRTFPSAEIGRSAELSPDVLRIGLTLPPSPASLPVVRCRDWALPLPDRFNPFSYLAIVMTEHWILFSLRSYSNVKFTFFSRIMYDFK